MYPDNAVQMTTYLLALHADRQPVEHGLEPLRIAQLLYAAERRSLQNYGETISDAEMVALPQGPALGGILRELNQVTMGTPSQAWAEWLRAEGERIILKKRPCEDLDSADLDALCEADLSILRWVEMKLGDKSLDALGEHLRQNCPEWQATIMHSSDPISLEAIFGALGFNKQETEAQVASYHEHQTLREANRELLC